ncbi:unnamed protein product [Absidia cylindrospora]
MVKNYDAATSTPDPSSTLPPTQFHYTMDQFYQLKTASDVCTILSMVAIAVVVAIYIYMLFHHPRDANRVSLRCVILANVVSFVNHCLALKASHDQLDTEFCASWRFVDGLFTVLPSCLLGMVGVHLFLVFVCHVDWPCRPEYILIPVAIFYTVVANVIPYFAEELPPGLEDIIKTNTQICWFYNAFLDRTYNKAAWIYYYSFMFFIIVVAFFSSISAMYKVYIEKKRCEERMMQITYRGIRHVVNISDDDLPSAQLPLTDPDYSENATNLILKNIHQQNTNPFTKVVARSLLYPLMPALTYSLGFALQMYLINPDHDANYVFAMTGNVLARLAGVFTAMIFFADPTVQTIPKEIFVKYIRRPIQQPPRPTSSVIPSSMRPSTNDYASS